MTAFCVVAGGSLAVAGASPARLAAQGWFAVTGYFRDGRTVDDLFRECLELVIEGATAKAAPPS
jgi:hypothetical protein